MTLKPKYFLLLFLIHILLIGSINSVYANPSWSISGEYFEGCTCNPGCPCLFGSEPTYNRTCEISGVFHIEKGKYNGLDLGGRTVIGVTDLTAKPDQNWIVFYISGKNASGDHEKALLDIFKNHVFGFSKVPMERTIIRYLPIHTERTKWQKKVIVSEYLILDLEILHGQGDADKPTQIANKHFPLWAEEFDSVLNMGKTVTHHLHETNREWNYDGRSGFSTTFNFTSK